MQRTYLEKTNQPLLNHLILTGKLHTYLDGFNEQVWEHYQLVVRQTAATGGVDEDLKRWSQWEWIQAMNSIVNRAEEIIKSEMIYV